MNGDTTKNATLSFTDILDFIGNFDTICGMISVAMAVVFFCMVVNNIPKKDK